MTEWKECKLKELADFNPDSLTAKSKLQFINYLDTGNITKGKIDTIQYLNLSTDKVPSRAKRIVKKNDIVYSTVRPNQEHYGIIKNPVDNMIVSTGFVVLRSKEDKCYSDFLYYFLTLPENTEYLSNVAEDSTTAYPSITPDVIMDMDISLPPLPEQKAIAEVLSSLDDKIDLLTRQNKTLEDLAQAYFRKWFIEDANDEWEEKSLYEVVDILSGGTPSTKVAEYWGGNIPWFTPKDASNLICMDTEKHITQEGLENCNSRLYSAGTVFISARGTVGKLAICGVPMAINQSCYALVGKGKMSNFIVYLILSYVLDELLLNATGAVFDAITTDTFKVIKLPLPPLNDEFYYRVKDILSTYYEKIVLNTRQIILLQKLRDILLPKLINGEIRIRM